MRNSFRLAIPLMIWTLGMTLIVGLAHSVDQTWVFMTGYINRYGNESVGGWCGAWAEIDRWAEVRAFWVKPQILPIPGNYTFHYARLVNASMVKLNYQARDFYILGLWDVLRITLVYDAGGNVTLVTEVVAVDAEGELYVTGGWRDLTIDIRGVNLLTGTVLFYRITSIRPIPIGDVSGFPPKIPDGEINIYDLVHVAKAYGDTPGMLGSLYDFDIDFNIDFTIDIYDLTTVAASLGESY